MKRRKALELLNLIFFKFSCERLSNILLFCPNYLFDYFLEIVLLSQFFHCVNYWIFLKVARDPQVFNLCFRCPRFVFVWIQSENHHRRVSPRLKLMWFLQCVTKHVLEIFHQIYFMDFLGALVDCWPLCERFLKI